MTQPHDTVVLTGLNGEQHRKSAPLHPAVVAVLLSSLAVIPLGAIGWIWASDWRWMASGLLAAVTLFILTCALAALLGKSSRKSTA